MPAKRFSEGNQSHLFAPRIYYFHPLLGGDRASWPDHLRRCQKMGFNHVLTAPPFAPGADGNIFLAGDHERVHPAVNGLDDADAFVAGLAETCRQHGLRLLVDLVVGRVAPDADMVHVSPRWFRVDEPTNQRVDPRCSLRQPNAAYARFDDPVVAKEIAGWWVGRLRRLIRRRRCGFPLPRAAARAGERVAPRHRRARARLSALPVSCVDAGTCLARRFSTERGGFCRGVFVAALVGRPRQLVRRRARAAAHDRLDHCMSGGAIRPAFGAAVLGRAGSVTGVPALVALRGRDR